MDGWLEMNHKYKLCGPVVVSYSFLQLGLWAYKEPNILTRSFHNGRQTVWSSEEIFVLFRSFIQYLSSSDNETYN